MNEMNEKDATTPRQASTVILTRFMGGEVQVYLLKRSAGSGFMPGLYVFPGGTVEPQDRSYSFWLDHVDLDPTEMVQRFGREMGVKQMLAHAVAAVRETLEEAGVLPAAGKDLQAVESHLIRRIREGSGDGSSGFQQEVRKADLRLRISLLTPWAHWITPRVNSRRFDTRFFHCHIPEGQHCIPDFVEAVDGLWISPAQALEGNRTGRIPLSPPTLVTLFELHQCGGAEGLAWRLRNGSWGEPRRPKIRFSEGRVLILLPWDPCYGEEGDDSDPIPQGRLVSLDEPFSRLVHREGLWHPACP